MENLLTQLENLLKQRPELKLISQDGSLLRNRIIEKGLKLDPDLLNLLLSHDRIKQHFFTQVGEVFVFDKEKFLQFVNNKQFLPDSFTAYKNKIGLITNGNFMVKFAKLGRRIIKRRREKLLLSGYY
ncbi:MAG TPA: site-specific DNA-methyltransferase [Paludibacter sp.]|nr:site-specific DNA-methyltransferase [Paludibacter sp.]